MPEELAIALLLLIVGGWIIITIIRTLASVARGVERTVSDALSRRKRERYANKKSLLSKYIQVVLPDQLDAADKRLISTESSFAQLQLESKWNARSLTSHSVSECLRFEEFPTLTLTLDSASFEYSKPNINDKKISGYFKREWAAVVEYNKRRSELLARCDGLNERIRERNELSQCLHVVLPDQLDAAKNRLDLADSAFAQLQHETRWNACRPTWQKEVFKPLLSPSKTELYQQMNVADMGNILMTTVNAWPQNELGLTAVDCGYPFQPPASNCLPFKEFPTLTLTLGVASYECRNSNISDKKLTQYFGGERVAVTEYNKRRAELLSQCDALNQRIGEWNDQSRLGWKSYQNDSKLLFDEEMQEFESASELTRASAESSGIGSEPSGWDIR